MTTQTRFVTHNGMDLSRSVGNPRSRFERIRAYLQAHGPATKREILRDVFGKAYFYPAGRWERDTYPPPAVTLGWGSYAFNLGVKYGYFVLTRKNGTVYWSLPISAQADGAA